MDHDADLDHDLDHDVGHDVGHDAGGAGWMSALRFLGVGQAPVTMVLLLLLGGFGILGWIINTVIVSVAAGYPTGVLRWPIFITVLGVDLALGFWFTSKTSRVIAQVVPPLVTTATASERLVSRRGRVTSPQVDETYGQVKVRDPGGTLITVFAVVDQGKPPIPRDTEVILVEYNPAKKVFVVVPSEM
jgi:hypothetical protein